MSEAAKIAALLANRDAEAALCPFARSPYPLSEKRCPRCGASSLEGCRRSPDYAFAEAVRDELRKQERTP